jgi:hypothetical protein
MKAFAWLRPPSRHDIDPTFRICLVKVGAFVLLELTAHFSADIHVNPSNLHFCTLYPQAESGKFRNESYLIDIQQVTNFFRVYSADKNRDYCLFLKK